MGVAESRQMICLIRVMYVGQLNRIAKVRYGTLKISQITENARSVLGGWYRAYRVSKVWLDVRLQ